MTQCKATVPEAVQFAPAKLRRAFYARPALTVAQELVGKILVRRTDNRVYRAQIIETEAYVGAHDLACHAAKGRTGRTEIMFGPAGFAYVYLIYGLHDMLNVVTGKVDDAEAVLIRGALPLDGWQADLSGPGRLTRAMEITRAENGADLLGDDLYFAPQPRYKPRLQSTKRIGVDYAGEWKDALLRFVDANHFARRR